MPSNFSEILKTEKIGESKNDFRNAIFSLDKNVISIENVEYLINIYTSSKQLDIRNKILRLLYDFDFVQLKDFFTNAFNKEKYLDMKIYALRGLSNFVGENEVIKLLEKFNQILEKRLETTIYNYQEYELLRGKNALPYLIERLGYRCFKETLEQVNKQYNAMPEAFKGHFTTNEDGEIVLFRKPEEVVAILNNYFDEDRKKSIK